MKLPAVFAILLSAFGLQAAELVQADVVIFGGTSGGVAAAIQARIPAERIVNFMTVDKLIEWVRTRRAKAVAEELHTV